MTPVVKKKQNKNKHVNRNQYSELLSGFVFFDPAKLLLSTLAAGAPTPA